MRKFTRDLIQIPKETLGTKDYNRVRCLIWASNAGQTIFTDQILTPENWAAVTCLRRISKNYILWHLKKVKFMCKYYNNIDWSIDWYELCVCISIPIVCMHVYFAKKYFIVFVLDLWCKIYTMLFSRMMV